MRTKKWLFLAWTLYTLTFILQIIFLGEFSSPEEERMLWTNVGTGFVITYLLVLGFIIPMHHSLENTRTSRKISILFFAGFLFCFLYISLSTLSMAMILGNPEFEWIKAEFMSYLRYNFHNVFKTYVFLTALLFAMEYFHKQNQLARRESDLKHRLMQAQLENLRSQFQPHFLFNALNSTVAVIDENKNKAQEMLVQLSDILRISINNRYDCEHSLKDELSFMNKYLQIEKSRYEDQLHVDFEIDPVAEQIRLPCLLLQPLLENAIKHGFKKNKDSLTVRITACSKKKTIRINNNGTPLDDHQHGLGLSNVRARLGILYDQEATFNIFQEGDWVINEIRLL